MFQPLIVIYRMGNFVRDHWGCTSICLIPYPLLLNLFKFRDRQLNQHVYPALHHPEIYLLHLGYKQFFTQYPDLCVGSYTTMDDPRHQVPISFIQKSIFFFTFFWGVYC